MWQGMLLQVESFLDRYCVVSVFLGIEAVVEISIGIHVVVPREI